MIAAMSRVTEVKIAEHQRGTNDRLDALITEQQHTNELLTALIQRLDTGRPVASPSD